MSQSEYHIGKFSCTTSRFLLPTFRRPCYREIIEIPVKCQPEDEVLTKWTRETDKYYSKINIALTNDDHEVLEENVEFINSLKEIIKTNNHNEPLKVYRGLKIDPRYIRDEYKVGFQFLWPTFTCTSRNKDIAHKFGEYTFEIDTAANDWTYRMDLSKHSVYPEEQEVLFYPYSGFVVKDILHDAKIVQLVCIDTLEVESNSAKRVPEFVKIHDPTRNMFVYLYKNSSDVCFSFADQPEKIFLIAENRNGYWDAPYRYHHCNGYFIDRGADVWEEYQDNICNATFKRVRD